MRSLTNRAVSRASLGPDLPADGSESSLTGGRLLARNVIWNGIGEAGPLLAAIVAMPILIHRLGTPRFGVLALTWVLFGYFGLFDFGLGRAVTKLVADKLGEGRRNEIPTLVWTALLLMLAFACVGSVILLATTHWAVHSALRVPADLQAETIGAFYLLALSLPIVVGTGALRGVLAAFQRFDLLNLVRAPLGMSSFLAPLLILPFSRSLIAISAILIVGRIVGCAAHFIQCLAVVPGLKDKLRLDRTMMPVLLTFGGWMTVSNIVSPLMTYMDRLLLGALVSMDAVAYYSTPYEMVTKLLLVPSVLLGVLFPAFAHALAQDRKRAILLFDRGIKLIFLALFPAVLVTTVFASDILTLWLGSSFAEHGARALWWLAIGVLINSLAQGPFALIQAVDRPDVTAKLHLVELPLYSILAWWMIRTRGVDGAAIAWTVRVAVDAVALFIAARYLLPEVAPGVGRLGWMTTLAVSALGLCVLPGGIITRAVASAVVLAAFAIAAWRSLLCNEERALVRGYLGVAASSDAA